MPNGNLSTVTRWMMAINAEDEPNQPIPQVQPRPREVVAEALQAGEILRQEVEERAGELVMRDAFQIDQHKPCA